MAIARKPRAASAAAASSEREIEALIGRGGSVAEAPERTPAPATAKVVLRLPAEMLDRIDAAVGTRRPRVPRHTWLLEAILEKLDGDDTTPR